MFIIQKLQGQPKRDPQVISSGLVKVAEAIGLIASMVCKNHERPALNVDLSLTNGNKPELTIIMGVCARSFTSLLAGFHELPGDVPGHLSGAVVYECVNMFDKILDSIEYSSLLAASEACHTELSKAGCKAKTKGSSRITCPADALTHLLYDLVSYLDRNDPHQREVFEGWLYILLKRVGDNLYRFTFGQRRHDSVEEDIRYSLPANQPHLTKQQKKIEHLAIQNGARAIMTVLKRALALAPYHLNPRSATHKAGGMARSASTRNLPTSSRVPLTAQMKERLQLTLIRCMFGEEDNDEFSNVLRRPAKSGRPPKEQFVEEKDVGAWLEKEVWSLVGWDLLAKEKEW